MAYTKKTTTVTNSTENDENQRYIVNPVGQ